MANYIVTTKSLGMSTVDLCARASSITAVGRPKAHNFVDERTTGTPPGVCRH